MEAIKERLVTLKAGPDALDYWQAESMMAEDIEWLVSKLEQWENLKAKLEDRKSK